MDFETIKVLKKWKKIDTTGSDSYAYFLIGFFYKKDNNCKEALKWFKKMLNGLPKKDLSILFDACHCGKRVRGCVSEYDESSNGPRWKCKHKPAV